MAADTSGGYVAETLKMTAGMLIWALHLGVVYAVVAVACARGFADERIAGVGLVPLAVGGATIVALAAAGLVLASALRALRQTGPAPGERRFASTMAAAVAGLALVAIAWGGLPALLVPTCS